MYIYMAWIFSTQHFQLTNGAKTPTHIVFCTFLIKSYQKLVDVPWKYIQQRHLMCKLKQQRHFLSVFLAGVKKGVQFFTPLIGTPFLTPYQKKHKKLLCYFLSILSIPDPYIFRRYWPNFDCFWWEIYRAQYVSMFLLWIPITQHFELRNGVKTLTHIVLCTFLIKSNQNLVSILWKYMDHGRLECIKNSTKACYALFGVGSKRVFNSVEWRIGHPFWPLPKIHFKSITKVVFTLNASRMYIF